MVIASYLLSLVNSYFLQSFFFFFSDGILKKKKTKQTEIEPHHLKVF